MKWLKETEFPEYNCRIIQNANNEIEIITKNAFGKPASLEYQKEGIIKKIRKKLGEEIRKSDEELLRQISYEYEPGSDDEIEFPETEFVKD